MRLAVLTHSPHPRRTLAALSVQVEAAHAQLSRYLARYQARLLGKNVYYIKQLLWLLRALGKQLAPPAAPAPVPAVPAAVSTDATTTAATTAGTAGAAGTTDRGDAPTTCQRRMLTINEFLLAADVDNVNLFAMERYLRRSDIAKKASAAHMSGEAAAATADAAVVVPLLPPPPLRSCEGLWKWRLNQQALPTVSRRPGT